jgi:hypothetical protein
VDRKGINPNFLSSFKVVHFRSTSETAFMPFQKESYPIESTAEFRDVPLIHRHPLLVIFLYKENKEKVKHLDPGLIMLPLILGFHLAQEMNRMTTSRAYAEAR